MEHYFVKEMVHRIGTILTHFRASIGLKPTFAEIQCLTEIDNSSYLKIRIIKQ
jgi:hypothetical protein